LILIICPVSVLVRLKDAGVLDTVLEKDKRGLVVDPEEEILGVLVIVIALFPR